MQTAKKVSKITEKRHKVKVRLTPSGWGFMGLIFCAFLISVNFSNNLIFAMTFLLAGIAMVSWYHTRSNIKSLVTAGWRCTPVFAGQKSIYHLAMENPDRNSYGVCAASSESSYGSEIHFSAGEQAVLNLERNADKRGKLEAIPVRVGSCFPLGIFQARIETGMLPECLVYPKPSGSQSIVNKPLDSHAHLKAESGEYKEMRRYSPGDSLSHINWKAFARFDELYTKEFDGAEGDAALWLCWDDVQAKGTEEKLSQLCRWVLDAHSQHKEYGLQIPGKIFDPANDETHKENCLRALALYGIKEENNEG